MASTIKTITAIIALGWLTTAHAQETFLVISDIHLDGSQNQNTISPNARNAGIDTWDTTKTEIDNLIRQQSPKFILYLGDLPLHVPPTSIATAMTNAGETLKALRGIAQEHHLPLLFVPGNNDSPDSDYGKFSPALFDYDTIGASLWPVINAPAIPNSGDNEIGYYAAWPLGRKAHLRVIVLNTVLYTWNYHSADQNAECQRQADWMGTQLHQAEASHETALIVMHVPPGVDTYKHNTFWTTQVPINGTTIQNTFLDTLAHYHNNIMGVFSSHTHMDGFKRLYDKDGNFIALLISAPAVAPSTFNNTAVKLIRFDKQRRLTGTTTFYHSDAWHSNVTDHKPLNPWFEHLDSASFFQLVDTLANTGVKIHNKDLDLDVRRNQTGNK